MTTPTATLDSLRKAAHARYGNFEIAIDEDTIVRLRNPLRLSKAERADLVALQEQMGAEDSDQGDVLRESLRLVAENKALADRLLDEVGDDLTVLAVIFESYSEQTQVGEA